MKATLMNSPAHVLPAATHGAAAAAALYGEHPAWRSGGVTCAVRWRISKQVNSD